MKKKLSLLMIAFLAITAFALQVSRRTAEPSVVYSWATGSENYSETGGTAVASGANDSGDDISKNYIRLKGKNDYSTNIITITLDNALHAGDKINVTGYRNKDAAGKTSGFKAKFDKGGEVASANGTEFVNTNEAVKESEEYGAEPNTCTFDVPEAAAGSTTITLTRSHTATNLYITKIEITSTASEEGGEGQGGEEPGEAVGPVTATWDFQNLIPATMADVNIQGTDATGTINSDVEGVKLNVLAAVAGTNIKLQYNSQGYAQFNQNTMIQVPVKSTKDVVTVVSYPGQSKYTVGGEDATGQNTFNHTATAAEVTKGYVEIIATATAYLYSIKVVLNEPEEDQGGEEPVAEDVTANWDWQNLIPATMADVNIQGNNEADVASDVDGIVMHVISEGGKLQYNTSGYAQFNQNTKIQVPVKNKGDEVTVVSYPGQSNYTVGGEDAKGQNTFTHAATSAEAADGFVEIIPTSTAYLYSIKVVQKAPSTEVILVEKSIYKTDFSDWSELTSSKEETPVAKTTKYSNEKLTFTFYNTGVNTGTYDESKFGQNNGYRIFCDKNAGGYITTSALSDITKVRFVHGATGGSRGYKLEAKGEGDADWVIISNSYASPNGWCEVNASVNKKNCQLRFTNLSESNYAYIFELEIFGNVDLSGAPLLGSFKANGKSFVADNIFEMGNDGNYHADIELFKDETMISAENPITDAVADNGEIGDITYTGDADQCTVTIPVTAKDQTVNYVANFVRKPFFTLTYVGPDGKVIGTQQAEKDAEIGIFDYDIAEVAATKDGYKARGWFKQNYVGEKFTTASIITEDTKLYAVETEIEVSSTSRKYEFNLADKNFYAEDHEAFNPAGNGYYWHDGSHGWAFLNGNTIDLLVGPKAIISIALCQYGNGTNILVKKGEETLETLAGKGETDGKIVSYTYEGEPGTITLEMVSEGEMYIHSVKIANIAETNYNQNGQWYFVKAGDVSSLLDALEIANGTSGSERLFVFIPNGTYDLGIAVKTPISRDNISLIGESMTGVIIKNAPPTSAEGLMSASTIHNTGNDLYMQDLTLQNDLDYYSAGSAGRANAFHDGGNRTIGKNVKLMSYQDTYLSSANKQYYWEDAEIHGAVDYICGGGDVFFENTTLINESRKKNEKNGEATITAHQPLTAETFGYVFNKCTIENKAKNFNFGRAWGGASGATVRPTVTYLNTTLKQPTEIIESRFITKAMNSQAGVFHEFNSMDAEGNVVSPETNSQTFTDKDGGDKLTYETILSAEEAAGYTLDKVFPSWNPAEQATQLEAPAATFENGNVTWTAVDGAIAYLIEKNGEFVGITTETSFAVEGMDAENDELTIRAANSRGGFGEAKVVTGTATSVKAVNAAIERGEQVIFNIAGQRVNKATKGLYIINGKKVVIK